MADPTEDPTAPTVRTAMTVSPIDAKRLKQVGLDFGTPAAVAARTFVNYCLDRLDDPAISGALTEAAKAERERRSRAAAMGGRLGGGSNKKKE
ncbi:hypothetical protein Gbro_0554 [Gordonia bronchialis DSM 43247]|uniref:Uncharacterized protein n=1 Tax=Gordonia bronchialis (strain ATCC 25592 / DSM 43247 / BCRC 13721 / JCM 3198 / KCTC 3076 / NBRC 16047 / NCTC 10667) TaxID=526226 RepID=D0LEG6_GORB4|nr:hypothetical protein [Gordonia bronchialis]ACY19884.1 hypothetical protein Gbro_0554 [Gordonia bronchialis DSM 43247]MCC3322656.1 hypothetical protein [Gordonia bronchialis]QGS26249.1 hypothetical protein FOB84_21065 [Gordonia bronchialis]STQ62661.1 Uncharacterised protein [Gordonia bronchialis]